NFHGAKIGSWLQASRGVATSRKGQYDEQSLFVSCLSLAATPLEAFYGIAQLPHLTTVHGAGFGSVNSPDSDRDQNQTI
ncbi:MAG TPA: hypothetical protein PK133_07755, partial [Ferruginibacter sp.]|nr:hypothetical protein [Ferruginibacter sp.]